MNSEARKETEKTQKSINPFVVAIKFISLFSAALIWSKRYTICVCVGTPNSVITNLSFSYEHSNHIRLILVRFLYCFRCSQQKEEEKAFCPQNRNWLLCSYRFEFFCSLVGCKTLLAGFLRVNPSFFIDEIFFCVFLFAPILFLKFNFCKLILLSFFFTTSQLHLNCQECFLSA